MNFINLDKLRNQLIQHEGLRLKPYQDIKGILTIGVGRNIEEVGITREEALYLLENDIGRVVREFDKALPWWRNLDEVRQRVLVDMGFNLGLSRLLGFKNMLAALQKNDFTEAAAEMESSKWFEQTKTRAERLTRMMEKGVDDEL